MQTKTASYPHKPHSATRNRVIDALVALGDGWHTVKDIAREMRRSRLYEADRGVLAQMVVSGHLEMRRQPSSKTSPIDRYEYKVVSLPGASE